MIAIIKFGVDRQDFQKQQKQLIFVSRHSRIYFSRKVNTVLSFTVCATIVVTDPSFSRLTLIILIPV